MFIFSLIAINLHGCLEEHNGRFASRLVEVNVGQPLLIFVELRYHSKVMKTTKELDY
jgi:hypothetical protein